MAQDQGADYLTGFVKTTNLPSMKMVTGFGWETIGRFDYLVLDLARFDGMAEPRAVQFDLYRDPHLMRLRLAAARSSHFAPRLLERELFSPAPLGAYAGSWTAISHRGTAWLSLWDDRRDGLDRLASALSRPSPELAARRRSAPSRAWAGPALAGLRPPRPLPPNDRVRSPPSLLSRRVASLLSSGG